MSGSKEVKTQQLRPLGCLGHFQVSLVVQLLSLMLFAVILVMVLVQVPKVLSSREQETIYQELIQLNKSVACLCRPCPWDWTFVQGNCYFFSKSKRDWSHSITACQEVGVQLVIIESAEEQSFLQKTVKNKGTTWMGLSDLNKEGTWHWVDGSPLSSSLAKYWKPGQPDNYQNQDCVEFKDDGWDDVKCDLKKFWICKKPAPSCSNK